MAFKGPRFVLGGALVLSIVLAAPAVFTSAGGQRLGAHSLDLLEAARAAGSPTVTLLIATAPGATKGVAARLASFGTVRFEDDDIGYVRVVVPTARAEAAAALDGIVGVELDETVQIPDPRPDRSEPVEWAPVAPDSNTPALNPYMPTQDTGAPQFVAAHPTYDGRGVVIGIVDTGIDLFTPELQGGKSLAGASVPKFKDWVTFTDPVTDGDPTWINMKNQVTVSGGTFSYGGRTYTGAPNGSFRVGVFKEADLGAGTEYAVACGPDVNRNGVCGETFGVLWRTTDNMVWVDANANGSFADDTPITDYKVARQVGTFGTDNPATPLRETVPFVVQTNGKDKFVNIGIVAGAHGTHVAGIAAGKDFFGGAFDGAAPEAQIVSVRACLFAGGCTNHAMTEGMIYAAKQSNVDVISMSIGGLPSLNDGNNARAILYNRLIDYSKVQMFFSAGNSYPGMNTVGDPSVATKVMSLGGYVSSDSWLVNYGAVVPKADGLFTFSSRGPAENGALKPDIVAPGSAVSCIPKWGQNAPLIPLPAGYDMYNGTSMAAPQASGGAALLVSAAKQAGVQYKPDQLRQAMHQSARYLPGYGAYEQGNGLLDIPAAWELLKTNIKTEEIVSYAPVNTVLSAYLAEPGYGPGIYQREGWSVGDSRTLPITFVRLKGTAAATQYALSWIGNDGTFESASSIALPRGEAVDLDVSVTAAAPGVHSAILQLKDVATGGVVYQVLNTIAAVTPFSVANNFTVSYAGQADKADKASFVFFVPAGTPAFKLDVTGINGRARLLRFHPYGYSVDNTSTTGFQTGGAISRTLSNPFPGVWEAVVEVSRTTAVNPTTFTVTGSLLGVDVAPATWTVDPTTLAQPYQQLFTFTNVAGGFTGGASAGALGTMAANRFTMAAAGPQRQVPITVPAGATRLDVRIGNPSDAGADLDLYLFNCTTGSCVQAASSAGATATEAVGVNNPAAGMWMALIDPYAVPSGSTEFDYTDQITCPGFLTLSLSDPSASHPYNATWSTMVTATAVANPGTGRFLYGEVQVKSGSSVLGIGKVMLKNVH